METSNINQQFKDYEISYTPETLLGIRTKVSVNPSPYPASSPKHFKKQHSWVHNSWPFQIEPLQNNFVCFLLEYE